MQDLIKQLKDSKRVKDGIPVPPSAIDLRAANAIEQLIRVAKGLELSHSTMQKELSDAQITITKLQIALANRTKELEDAKKNINIESISNNNDSAFTSASNAHVDNPGP